MKRERYLADIDQVLEKTLREKSPSIADKRRIKFSEDLVESGQFKKIAFDVYKVDNDPYENIWLLEDVDGIPHLVRASDPSFESATRGEWSAISDYEKSNITLAYKNTPVARFSSNDYGFSRDDIITFKSALLNRVSGDADFVKEVLAEQPQSKRLALADTFPELRKFV
jgi:hypothetical protein